MSCNSCSNVTLPGVVGPAGAAGADGNDGNDGLGFTGGSYDSLTGIVTFTSDDGLGFSTTDLRGADGVDGVPVLFMDTTGPNTASNNATSAGVNSIRTDLIDGGTIGTVGDFIKIKGEVIADAADNYFATVRIKFGGADMFVWYAGMKMGGPGLKFEVDLVVSDTDEIRPHVSFTSYKVASRLNQSLYNQADGGGGVLATLTSAIALGSNQNIEVEIDSDGVNTATLTYYEVTKYLKV